MLLCLACYGDRLASLAENAECFRLYRVDGGVPVQEGSISPPGRGPAALSAALASCGVEELICGGMTGCTRRFLTEAGVTVRPWIKGTLDEVLAAWTGGGLEALSMPGCGGPRCVPGLGGDGPGQRVGGRGCGQGARRRGNQNNTEPGNRQGRSRRQGGSTGEQS